MTTVSTKGKCDWVLQTEYGVRTICTYLCFGMSLGMVQIRHNLRNWSVYCHEMVRRRPRLPGANKRKNNNIVSGKEESSMTHSEQVEFLEMLLNETIKLMQLTQREGVHVRLINLFARQEKALCANEENKTHVTCRTVEETSKCVFNGLNFSGNSNKGKCHVSKTKTKVWVNDETTVGVDENVNTKTEKEEIDEVNERNALFLLSRNDPAYAQSITEHKPVVLSYRNGLYLHHLLSQVIGWELLLLHRTQENIKDSKVNGVEVLHSTEEVESHKMSKHKLTKDESKEEIREQKSNTKVNYIKNSLIDESCVAIMLPNCVEYNIIWLACAEAGVMHTFLDALYLHNSPLCTPQSKSKPEKENKGKSLTSNNTEFVYHPSRVALINTNLTNNAMLFHALECVNSELVILDVAYAGLLFDTITSSNNAHEQPAYASSTEIPAEINIKMKTKLKLILHVPTCVKRIYLWRWNGKFTSNFTQEMAMQLNAFHQVQYSHIRSTTTSHNCNNTLSEDHPLDLFSYVSEEYTHFTQCSTPFGQASLSLENEIHHFNYLTSHIIAYPPLWMTHEQCTSMEHVNDKQYNNPLSCNTHSIHTNTYRCSNSNSNSSLSMNELSSDANKTDTNSINTIYQNDNNKVQHTIFIGDNNSNEETDNMFIDSNAILRRRSFNPLTQINQPIEQEHTTQILTATRKTKYSNEDNVKEQILTSKCIITPNFDQLNEQTRIIVVVNVTSKQVIQFYRKLRSALNLFHYTHPILYIYTSGTTGGLPKAAKFSHLRFFATCYLSRVLHFRDKTSMVWQTEYRNCERETKSHGHRVDFHQNGDSRGNKEQRANVQSKYYNVNSNNNEGNVSVAHEHELETPTFTAFQEVVGDQMNDTDNYNDNISDRKNHKIDNVHESKSTHQNCVTCTLHTIRQFFVAMIVALVQFLRYVFSCCTHQDRKQTAQNTLKHELDCLTVYVCLPMYHTVGCVFCLCHLMHALEEQHSEQVKQQWWNAIVHPFTLCHSASSPNTKNRSSIRVPTARLLLRSKFSASQFTVDCQQYHVTVVQYIGEVLRYALQSEYKKQSVNNANNTTLSSMQTKKHVEWLVPYAFGNGLRKDIWHDVINLLHIAQPVEFYSSTEGNVFLFNLYNIPGVIGHIARLPGPINYILGMHYLPAFPFRVVKYDETSQDIWRDAHSHYSRRVGVNEVGEILGEIVTGFDLFALRRFDGYHSINGVDAHGAQKIITHVLWPFAHATFFRSGDLVMFDKFGFCTFVDRVGDTFRWKGENVSTVEVSNALHTITGTRVKIEEAIVYGVTVPLCEGRAGMALLKLQHCHYTKKNVNKSQSNDKNSCRIKCNDINETDLHPVTLSEEQLFLQNEFYKCLNGQSVFDVDNVIKPTPLLPSYAIPLFIRIDHHQIMSDSESHNGEGKANILDDEDDTSNQNNINNKTKEDTDTHMTTTFKYRKFVLIKENYMLHLNKGEDCDSSDLSTCPSSSPRIYVLVKNRVVIDQLAIEPKPDAKCNGAYVPLTRRTVQLIGSNFTECGW